MSEETLKSPNVNEIKDVEAIESESLPVEFQNVVSAVERAAKSEEEKKAAEDIRKRMIKWIDGWKEIVGGGDVVKKVDHARWHNLSPGAGVYSRTDTSGRDHNYPAFQLTYPYTGGERTSEEFFVDVLRELGCINTGEGVEDLKKIQKKPTSQAVEGFGAQYCDPSFQKVDRLMTREEGVDVTAFYGNNDHRIFVNVNINVLALMFGR